MSEREGRGVTAAAYEILCASCRAVLDDRGLNVHLDQECRAPNGRHKIGIRDCIECGKPWRPPESEPGNLVCSRCVREEKRAAAADDLDLTHE